VKTSDPASGRQALARAASPAASPEHFFTHSGMRPQKVSFGKSFDILAVFCIFSD
jgi:hypothetical protein